MVFLGASVLGISCATVKIFGLPKVNGTKVVQPY